MADDLSFDIVIEKRERSFSYGEPRVGIMVDPLGAGAAPAAQTEDQSKAQILQILTAFENLAPDQVLPTNGQYTLQTYSSVSQGQLLTVDQNKIQQWQNSQAFKDATNQPKQQTTVSQVAYVFTDSRTATVTYQISEGGQSAKSSAIFVRLDDGNWRIAVHCPHPV